MLNQKIKQTLKYAAIAAMTVFVGSASASASSYSNASRINQIINKLDPSGWSYGGAHSRGYSGSYYNSHKYSNSYSHGYDYGHQPIYSGHYSYENTNPYYANSYYDLDDSVYNRTMDLSVYFERGSSRITWRTKKSLDNLGYALTSTRLSDAVYRIAGHTDAKGDRYANRHLSQKRAHAVKKYLIHKFHINPRRLVTVGFGEDRLKNAYRPYSSINRRVEVTLIANSYADLPNGTYTSDH